MINQPQRFRKLFGEGQGVIAPGVYDCLSAKIAEQAGFKAVMVSGAGLAASALGLPDIGLMSFDESLAVTRRIAAATSLPIIADCDDGFGNALNAYRTVRLFEQAGVAALFIEDQKFPKRCGHFEGKALVEPSEMVEKIRAALDARSSDDFLIIARTDARGVEGAQAALDRARLYAEAGADGIFIEAPLSRDELVANVAALADLGILMMANMAEGGKTPLFTGEALMAMGYQIVTFPGALQKTALWAMQGMAESLARTSGVGEYYPDRMMGLSQRSDLLGLDGYTQRTQKYTNSSQSDN